MSVCVKVTTQFSVQETWKQSISPDLLFSVVQSGEKEGQNLSLCSQSILIFPQYLAHFLSQRDAGERNGICLSGSL